MQAAIPGSTCHPASCRQIHHPRASADQIHHPRTSADQKDRNSHHVRPLRRTPAADDQESPDPHARFAMGAAAVIPALLIGVLGSTHSDPPRDSGLVACTYPLSTQDVPAAEYPKIRAQFAGLALACQLLMLSLAHFLNAFQQRSTV
jgi:hypothetical protein